MHRLTWTYVCTKCGKTYEQGYEYAGNVAPICPTCGGA